MKDLSERILPGSTIGIIGGGIVSYQLVLSAKKMRYKVAVLSESQNCIAGKTADIHFVCNINDEVSLLKLAEVSDVVTVITETLDKNTYKYLAEKTFFSQNMYAHSIVKNRYLQKQFLDSHSINITPYESAVVVSDVYDAAERIGYPCIIKQENRQLYGWDNNLIIHSAFEINQTVPLIQQGLCVVESYIEKQSEWEITLCLNDEGYYTIFPPIRIEATNIGELPYIESFEEWEDLKKDTVNQMELITKVIASELGVSGTVKVSYFLTNEDNLYVNNIYTFPREHDILTIHSCSLSVFDLHIKSICNFSLPAVRQLAPTYLLPLYKGEKEALYNLMEKKNKWQFFLNDGFRHTQQEGFAQVFPINKQESLQEIKYAGLISDSVEIQDGQSEKR
ncbi:ATP-grasp domain-containing protein [Vagococcus sp. CY52-2]|uniref:ATP-grasp domain-containing protein n=1 Tax=Vagococcus sp. CY52-2 TaxID=2925838 RepID=UPI000E535C0E|nr:ATP-grasp domain-containing protein [Vagococcus sp. CY52-2]RGI30924.1 ATP-grasp domain-containing protein [Melissococcus sp. OM08-11BH]UNM88885.1 ATP-grasp domain-containing protein [Vagococcus sp. CY52-2]